MNKDTFDRIEENVDLFLEKITDCKLLEKIIKKAATAYYNDEPLLFDDTYDLLVEKLTVLCPNSKVLKSIGAPVNNNKVTLPFHMGSMNKIKPEDNKKFQRWTNTHTGPYILSYKLDGISALLCVTNQNNTIETKLYTRGDGTTGQDISHLLQYINIGNIVDYVTNEQIELLCLRGELIMKKDTFYTKYANVLVNKKMPANPRNFVSGNVNSKTPDPNILADINLVFYEVVHPWNDIKQHFILLNSINNINIVPHELINKELLTIETLSNTLKTAKNNAEYEIDGLIISDTNEHERNTSDNPTYSIAFKENTEDETKEAIVLNITWNISKDNIMVPVVNIVPIKLSGVTISNITGNNAKFISENEIGQGAVLKITRSGGVIPKIISVIKPSSISLFPDTPYIWNDTGVHIINNSNDPNQEQFIKEAINFITTLEIPNANIGTVRKFVENKIINNLTDLFLIANKRKEILNIDGFGPKKTDKILQSFQLGFENITLQKLMKASNIFGRSIGEKKIEKILNVYPNVLTDNIHNLAECIDNIEGFDIITSNQFVKHLDQFKDFMKTIPQDIQDKLLTTTQTHDATSILPLESITVLFTGFRNKQWKTIIENNGGVVSETISKNLDYVVTKFIDEGGAKLDKARQLKLKIVTQNDFINIMQNEYNITL